VLHLLPHAIVLTAFCKEEEVVSDKAATVVTVQKEGDLVGDFEIEGLKVDDGLVVGINVGNFVGTLLGTEVGLEAKSTNELIVPSSHT